MNTGTIETKAGRLALIGRVLVGLIMLTTGAQAKAAASDAVFQQYITDICFMVITPPQGVVWDTVAMCTLTSTGWAGAGGPTPAVNLGTVGAGNSVASRKKNGTRIPIDGENEQQVKGASADGQGWGLLLAPQYGKGTRVETNLENGYRSTLSGILAGLDYRSSDTFVFGITVSSTKDDSSFNDNVGSLKSQNNVITIYGTLMQPNNITVDGYVGYGQMNLKNVRKVVFGTTLSGITNGSTTGRQSLAGMSVSYQNELGSLNISPFIAYDFIKSNIDGFNETGSTTLEMHYNERVVISSASNIGARVETSSSFKWGSLQFSGSLAAAHEFQNKSRQISNELVITPGASFMVQTDTPDRNYLNIGLGISAALNGGNLFFLDYEKHTNDKLLNSWAVSLGGLFEF